MGARSCSHGYTARAFARLTADRHASPLRREFPHPDIEAANNILLQKASLAVDRIVDRESVRCCASGAFRDGCAAICAGSVLGAVCRAPL